MIIIPTEKRFDWKHAPIALFAIVILNIFIFFIPQSGDNEIIAESYLNYQEQDFLAIEWPFLKRYLKETEQNATLEKLSKLYAEEQFEQVIAHILFDDGFYRYLRQDQYDYFFNNDEVGDWFAVREQINSAIQSTTLLSHALIPSDPKPFAFISYQFMHGSVMHLLGNLFFLIICGFAVEAAIGHGRFLLFYLLAGIAGGVLHAVFNSQSAMPLVGASGAISGTMAMYLGLFRLKKIEFFYWFFVFVGYFRAPALFILVFYIGKEVVQLFSDTQSNTAFLAHIGGFVAGAIAMGISYKLKPDMFNQEYIEEDQSIDPLQEKKATVYEFLGKYQFDAAEKALGRIIDSEGLDFELALLRYNIEKLEKNKNYKAHLVELLLSKQPSEHQANKLEKIWQDNATELQKIDPALRIKIAINLAESSSPTEAGKLFQQIFTAVEKTDNTRYHTALAVLAKKLADAHGRNSDFQQQKKFTALTQQLLAGKA